LLNIKPERVGAQDCARRRSSVTESWVDARYLTQKDRDAFKMAVIARRDAVGRVIKRMEARQWFTDDAVLHNLRSAWHALHAAVQALGAVDGQPVKHYSQGPRYPL
jgi:hypothetical protein